MAGIMAGLMGRKRDDLIVVEARRHRWPRGLAGLTLVLLGAVPAGPAFAAAEQGIDIDHIEMADNGTVSVLLGVDRLPDGAAAGDVTVQLDGETLEATARPVRGGELQRTTVLVIDTSNSMRGARIEAARAAAQAFLDAAPTDVGIGLVTFAGTVRTATTPTADHGRLIQLVDDLELTRGTRVYDAVLHAVRIAGEDGARSVLLLSDGRDTGSRAGLARAADAARDAGVVVDVVSIDQDPAHLTRMTKIADASGGAVLQGDAGTLPRLFAEEGDALASQLLVTFTPPQGAAQEAALEVSIAADGTTYADRAFVTLVRAGPEELSSVSPGGSPVGRTALLIGAGALGLGLAAVLAVALLSAVGPSAAQRHLAAYLDDLPEREPQAGGLRGSAIEIAENLVEGERSERLRRALAAAGSAATPAEWVLGHAGVVVISGLVGLILGGPVLMVVMILLGATAPWLWLQRRGVQRRATFGSQLPETLNLIAGGLSAGLSLPQAIDTVVREGQEPTAGELRRALVEQRLGIEMEDALDAVGDRMQSEDFSWIVMAVRIQHEVGGNLAEVLNTVAETLREREYLRRQVRALSAEGRLSAWILSALPVLMFGYMLLTNREYVQVFWTEVVGVMMLGSAIVMLALGTWSMSRLAKVQV